MTSADEGGRAARGEARTLVLRFWSARGKLRLFSFHEIKPRASLSLSVLSSRAATAGTLKSSPSLKSARSGASKSDRSPKLGALEEQRSVEEAKNLQSPDSQPKEAAGADVGTPAPVPDQATVQEPSGLPDGAIIVAVAESVESDTPAKTATVTVNASVPALAPTPFKATVIGAGAPNLPDVGPARGLSALQLGAALAAPPPKSHVVGVHVETLQSVAKSVRDHSPSPAPSPAPSPSPEQPAASAAAVDAQSLNAPAQHNQPFRPKGLGALERIAKDKGHTPTSAKTPKAQHGGEIGAMAAAPAPSPSTNQEMLTPESPIIEATVLPSLAATAEHVESPNLD
jgi:hypothetical protein